MTPFCNCENILLDNNRYLYCTINNDSIKLSTNEEKFSNNQHQHCTQDFQHGTHQQMKTRKMGTIIRFVPKTIKVIDHVITQTIRVDVNELTIHIPPLFEYPIFTISSNWELKLHEHINVLVKQQKYNKFDAKEKLIIL